MKRFTCINICICLLLQIFCTAAFAAENTDISLFINGTKTVFENEVTASGDTYLVPFKELMNKLGIFTRYDEESSAYVCTVNGAEAEVPLNSGRAAYDSVWIELDNETRGIDGDVLTELEFIDKIYGIDVSKSGNKINISAKIEKDTSNDDEKFDIDRYLSELTPKNITLAENDLFRAADSDPALVKSKEVKVEGAPGFDRALEVENLTEPKLSYSSQFTITTNESISAGDVLVATIYARKIKCIDESGFATFNFTFEALDVDWTKFQATTEQVAEDWTKFTYVFAPTKDLKVRGAHLAVRVGFRLQTIQFGGLSIVNYGKKADISLIAPEKVIKTTYKGREDGALWREEALKRIEKYRKNDITVKVTDENGNPVSGAKVRADMTKSEFLWGNAMNEIKGFTSRRTTINYQRIMCEKFNSVTNESAMKPASTDTMGRVNEVNFARQNNMHFRAHTVFWDALKHFPSWGNITADSTEQEVLDFLKGHASMLLYTYGDTIEEMDVVNEPLNNSYFRDKFGSDFIVELYKTVKDIAPDVRLFVNETGVTGNDSNWTAVGRLRAFIDEIQEKGAPIEGVGLQNHSAGMIYPQTLYNQIDYLSENLSYAAITEYDYLSNLSNNVDALSCEADYLRDMLITAYSHPKMTGFTMWGFGDFGHWRLNAPLYFESYAPKPALKEWDKYVLGEWFTKAEAVTDENGIAVIRGHRGDYDITVESGGKSAVVQLVLSKDGENTVTATLTNDGITLTSSQLPKQPLPQIPYLKAVYGEPNARDEYKKLYENKAERAVRSNGADAGFLLEEDNTSVCSVDKENYVTAELAESVADGYIIVDTSGDGEALIRIEGISADGSSRQIYAGETANGKINMQFNGEFSKIKISGLVDVPAILKYISVSQREIRD